MEPLEAVKAFVEGHLPGDEFQQLLLSDPELEKTLSDPTVHVPSSPMADGELYYLILEEMPLLGRERNSQAWLADFLSAVGMAATPTEAYARRSDLMLKVQPRWLDLPNAYLADLMAEHEGKTGKDLESALKQSIEDRFKYLSQPPTWLQAPAWPIKNGRPLVFVGQLDTTPIRHDSACLYVFYDADAGTFETVEQSA